MWGVPTISYEGIPNADERYLVRKGLVSRCRDYKKIPQAIEMVLSEDSKARKAGIKRFLDAMEDPYNALESAIRTLG